MTQLAVSPTLAPPSGEFSVHVSGDGQWYWDGYGWRPTAQNPWSAQPAAPTLVHMSPDGIWWWDGYYWRPTPAAVALWESERLRRRQRWITLGAGAALLFLR